MDPFDAYTGINLYGNGNQGNPINPYNSNPPTLPPPGQQQPGGGPRIPPFSPDEESLILSRLGSGALKGLGYVGSSLGKAFGGRAIRGLLGGHLDELASIIPFSDTLGITDPEREVRGSDLLGGDKDTSLLSAQGLGGLGLDVLLDPATYLTFGGSALTEAGQAAKRAGTLADTATRRMLSGQQGLVGLGLPFTHPSAVFGANRGGVELLRGATDLASQIPGATGLYNKVLEPAGRAWNYLFDPTVSTGSGSAFSAEGQRAARMFNKQRQLNDVAIRKWTDQAGEMLGDRSPQALNELRTYMELGPSNIMAGPWRPGTAEAGDFLAQKNEKLLALLQKYGMANELTDPAGIGYAARQLTPLAKETAGYGKVQQIPTTDVRLGARDPIFKGFGRGTQEVNELTSNQALYDALQTAPNQLDAAAQIRATHFGWTPETEQEMYGLRNAMNEGEISARQTTAPPGAAEEAAAKTAASAEAAANSLAEMQTSTQAQRFRELTSKPYGTHTPEELTELTDLNQYLNKNLNRPPKTEVFDAPEISYPSPEGMRLQLLEGQKDQSERLADFIKNLDPKIVERGGMFLNNPLEDFASHAQAVNRVAAGSNATMNMLKNAAAKNVAGESVPLSDVLDRVFGKAGQATSEAKMQMVQRLGLKNSDELFSMHVPQSIAADAGKFLQAYSTPEGLQPFLKIWDSVTNLTKAGQTSLWPAFHARNAATGLWQNYVTNAFDPRYGVLNPMRYLRPFMDAWKLRNPGAVLEGANELPFLKGLKLTEEEATQRVLQEASAHRILNQGNQFTEVIGGEGLPKTMRLPGEGAVPLFGKEGKLATSTYNPLDIAGVGGIAGVGKSNETRFIGAVAGQHLGEAVDQTNRLSAFIAKLRQGFTPEAASAESKLAHFDYSALTPFERNIARRVIPFYNWMSNNIPFTVRQLAQQPGGKLGVALKASGEAQGRTGGFLPDQVASGLGLPLGEDKEAGTKTFLSHTGLPFEDIARYASGTDYLQALNPLLKAPVELATGHQFESGRRLADLYQSPTNSTVANELIANSPFGRFITTGRTLTDERKSLLDRAVNVLTGMHQTTVDVNKAETVAARNYIEDALSGNPHFRSSTDLSVRPDALADLSPTEIALLRLKATLDRQSQQQAAQQRRVGVRMPA